MDLCLFTCTGRPSASRSGGPSTFNVSLDTRCIPEPGELLSRGLPCGCYPRL